jgi:hypothetical protein
VLESLRRALLGAPLGAVAGAALPGATGANGTAGAPGSGGGANGSADPLPGAPVGGDAAQFEPDDLAWLVNEALIEQARRHGVDLS